MYGKWHLAVVCSSKCSLLSLSLYVNKWLFIFCYLLQVLIIRGKDKGDTGIIKRVIRTQNRVIVEGKNLVSDILSF